MSERSVTRFGDVFVAGWGRYHPDDRQTRAEIAELLGVPEQVISAQYGLIDKPIEKTLHPTEMAGEAIREALLKTGTKPADVQLLVFANSGLTDFMMWSPGSAAAHNAGIEKVPVVDLMAGCNSMVAGIDCARNRMLLDDRISTAVVVSAERSSACFHEPMPSQLRICLAADGAAAAVLTREPRGLRVLDYVSVTRSELRNVNIYPWGGTRYWLEQWEDEVAERGDARRRAEMMSGFAISAFGDVSREALSKSGLQRSDLRFCFLNHDRPQLTRDRLKAMDFVEGESYLGHEHDGHVGGVDPLVAMEKRFEDTPLNEGEHVQLCAISAGQSWGALVLGQTNTPVCR